LFFLSATVLIGLQFFLWPAWWFGALLALPLGILSWFAARGSLRAFGAAGLYCLVFLIHGLTEAVARAQGSGWAIAETVATLGLFAALLGIAKTIRRWRAQQLI